MTGFPSADLERVRDAYRVAEFGEHWLTREYGRASLSHFNDGDGGPIPDSFRDRRGIIQFVVPSFDDATGHLDLWNGDECVGHGYFHLAREIHLWGADALLIQGSVGSRGRNAEADVRVVQRLLQGVGEDPGPADGVIGARTRAAIRSFQATFLQKPDGRIDVDGSTWLRLSAAAPRDP